MSEDLTQSSTNSPEQGKLPGERDLVLVTGATGFVGSHLVERLVERGYRVRVLVRSTSDPRWISGVPVELAYGDVRDKASLSGACVGVKSVFHFGGVTRARSAGEFKLANEMGTRNLAEALAERGQPGGFFVYCSSLAAGGPAIETVLQPEPIRIESDPPAPITPYGRSKLGGELALEKVARETGRYRTAILRPPAVYGPRDSAILVFFRFIKYGFLPLGGPENGRLSLIFVDDLIDAAVSVAEKGVQGTFYVCDEEIHAWRQIGQLAAEIMDVSYRTVRIPGLVARTISLGAEMMSWVTRHPPTLHRWRIRDMQQRHWVCSSERAKETWGFESKHDIVRGLEETLTWYRENHWL